MTAFAKTVRKWWPTALVVAVIAYATLSSNPVGAESIPLFPGADKLIHAIMFGGLFAAIVFDLRRDGKKADTQWLCIIAAIALAAGALDELTQELMRNGRKGDILDLAADAVGIAVAYFTAPPVINHIFNKLQN